MPPATPPRPAPRPGLEVRRRPASERRLLSLSLRRGGRALDLDRAALPERCRARRDVGRSAGRGERPLGRRRARRLRRAGSARSARRRARVLRPDARVHRPGARRLSAGLGDPPCLAHPAAPPLAAHLRSRPSARARLLPEAGLSHLRPADDRGLPATLPAWACPLPEPGRVAACPEPRADQPARDAESDCRFRDRSRRSSAPCRRRPARRPGAGAARARGSRARGSCASGSRAGA